MSLANYLVEKTVIKTTTITVSCQLKEKNELLEKLKEENYNPVKTEDRQHTFIGTFSKYEVDLLTKTSHV